MGVAKCIIMFVREVKNRSGSVSIQIISKAGSRYRVIKTVGCGTQRHDIDHLKTVARQEIDRLQAQPQLFTSEDDELIEGVLSSLSNSSISTVGPELIFGHILGALGRNCSVIWSYHA